MSALAFSVQSLERVPVESGVYLFRDAAGKVLYVGKAKRLRERVRSYFGPSDGRPVTLLLQGRAKSLDWVVTAGEKQALVLENSLIKQHKPALNVKLRDDSLYFSLQLDPREAWPRLRVVRKRKGPPGSLFFGPYASVRGARRLVRELNSVFPLRSCDDEALRNRSRPCIEHEIGRCLAPCVAACTSAAYASVVKDLIELLRGQEQGILQGLEQRMHEAALALEYERAADLRDRIAAVRTVLQQPQLSRRGDSDEDAIGVVRGAGRAVICVLQVRAGVLSGSSHYEVPDREDITGLVEATLLQHYSSERRPPRRVLVPELLESAAAFAALLSDQRGTVCSLRHAQRGPGAKLQTLATRNARLRLESLDLAKGVSDSVLAAVQQRFQLRHLPTRIEGFDISHQFGSHVTGSCVAFLGAQPDPSRYRSFRLREVQRNDDFAAMEEVLRRRVTRGLAADDLPELLVIDGGPPQLARVLQVLRDTGAAQVDVLALAKGRSADVGSERGHERVWLPGAAAPLILDHTDPSLLLLMRVRDEAHRRALRHSRSLKRGRGVGSVLESIPGVGPAKASALLRSFGSVAAIRRLDAEALVQVKGVSLALAGRILEQLRVMD
ncbi:MAG: excinuclease ABC subunit UvrC [Planctomycetes bacterium]|nr:excinuclease ABC subunit UvrC [Planctomycetota bacterium]